MTANTLTTKLLEIKRAFDASMKDIPSRLRRELPAWQNYGPEAQAREINAVKMIARAEAEGKLEAVARDVASAQMEATKGLTKIQFPAMTSSDVVTRTLGELQLQSARAFLSANPEASAIGTEARDALALGRTDAAWLLIQRMRDAVPSGGAVNDGQRAMQAELLSTLEAVGNIVEVAELEKETNSLPAVQRAVSEFQQQLAQGREQIILPDLFRLLTEEEREVELTYIQGASSSLAERVSMKRRASEALKPAG